MLLDVSRLRKVTIDREQLRATVEPGRPGHEFSELLRNVRLFFPGGHCPGVALGGYLLQGGYGWHSRRLGPACMSVEGLDMVSADGRLVHASAAENADLYWAARGAGPGFFGIVTRFHLRLYPRPKVIALGVQTYAAEMFDEVFRWLHAVGPDVPDSIELQALMSRDTPRVRGPGITVVAPVFADTWSEAWEALRFFRTSPLRGHARLSLPIIPCSMRFLYRGVRRHYPDRHRYAVDNMWTRASIDDLLPGLRTIAETLPAAPSHMLWMNWAPPASRPDMAYSVEDNIYLALYSVWQHAADDAQFANWPINCLRPLEHLSSGCQLADENLAHRPQRFVSEANLERLDRLRAAHDPERCFYPWMGRP